MTAKLPFNPANALTIVADSAAQLRGCDLGRLFETYTEHAGELADYVLAERPDLLARLQKLVADMEADLLADDPLAALQMEWETPPLPELRAAIAKATNDESGARQ